MMLHLMNLALSVLLRRKKLMRADGHLDVQCRLFDHSGSYVPDISMHRQAVCLVMH